MTTQYATRECPFCKEEIKAEAVKCKHCHSTVKPETPPHGGTCPFCKEEIKSEAIKCKHCGSMVDGSAESGGCAGCAQKDASGLITLSSVGTNNLFPFPTEGVIALQSKSCSGCSRLFGGIRTCCQIVCFPPFGCRNYCWSEPCSPPGTILA